MFHHRRLSQNGREEGPGSHSLYPEAQFPGWHGPVLRKGCACYWGACDTRQVRAPESCQSVGVLGQVAAPKAVLGVVGGVPLFINHGNRERCAELWGGSSHPPRSAVGAREAECGLSPGSLCAPVAARRLGGRDRDQGLGLPECGFLLSGLDGLVLAKV